MTTAPQHTIKTAMTALNSISWKGEGRGEVKRSGEGRKRKGERNSMVKENGMNEGNGGGKGGDRMVRAVKN